MEIIDKINESLSTHSYLANLRERITIAVLSNPNHKPHPNKTNNLVSELMNSVLSEYDRPTNHKPFY